MRSKRRDLRAVFQPTGAVIVGLGVMILVTCGVGALWNELSPRGPDHVADSQQMAVAGVLALALGFPLFRYGKRFARESFTRREAVLAVALIWAAASFFGALPFVFAIDLPLPDAIFESVSGLTTTGATVIEHIETRLSRPVLLWRSLIQWLGGMGIVVLFVAVFPNVGAGGKHMFRGEVPGTTAEGLKPRIAETSFALWKLYAALTALEAVLLVVAGMEVFDAICHAFTTMSTGGFSTIDASIGGFHRPAIEYIVAIFMLAGSVNYALYYAAIKGRTLRVIVRSIEFQAFVGIVLASVAWLFFFNLAPGDDIESEFRNALFMVATTISSTGYGTHDYTEYTTPAFAMMLLMMFVGGCSGSTAGGLKVERVVLMGKQALGQVKKSYRPAAVELVRMGRAVVGAPIMADVMAFTVIFFSVLAAGVLIITMVEGVSVQTAFGANLTAISNMGPAPYHETVNDNFAAYCGVSKLWFSLVMLLGRLEFFTLFALVVPSFWKR